MSELVCRSEQVGEGSFDAVRYFVPDEGFLFDHPRGAVVTRGAAVTISVPGGPHQVERSAQRVTEALGSIRAVGEVAPFVVGALPFDGRHPATLVVPRSALVRRGDGSVWRVAIGSVATEPAMEPADPSSSSPSPLHLTPIPRPASYVDAVATAVKRIIDGDLHKVVLARMLMARAEEPFDRRVILSRLRDREPDAYLFGVHGFVGASPELLVGRSGRLATSTAVAGTIPRGKDPDGDERAARTLLTSPKERGEHALVVEAVQSGLEQVCESVHAESEPDILRLRTVLHLVTEVRGTLKSPSTTALDLASLLHPTPSVCGTPRAVAMSVMRELEGIDRTLYAGLVGWADARGDGEWALALRCAEVQGRIALLFAGAGIVAGSDPEAELAETEAKFSSMLGTMEDG